MSSMGSPDFSLTYPPRVRKSNFLRDPDRRKIPTVERLVERGSWPAVSLNPPGQALLDRANDKLRQLWLGRQQAAAAEANETTAAAAVAEAKAAETRAAAEAVAAEAEAKAKSEAEAEAKQKAEDEMREKVKAEIEAEKAAAEAAAKAAEEAAKVKEEEEEKMKKDAVAAYVAEQNAKKTHVGMSTRWSYCYHQCGVHPHCEIPLYDGVVEKGPEKEKGKEKEKERVKVDKKSGPSEESGGSGGEEQQAKPKSSKPKSKNGDGGNGSKPADGKASAPVVSAAASSSTTPPALQPLGWGLDPAEWSLIQDFRSFKIHEFESRANHERRGDLPRYRGLPHPEIPYDKYRSPAPQSTLDEYWVSQSRPDRMHNHPHNHAQDFRQKHSSTHFLPDKDQFSNESDENFLAGSVSSASDGSFQSTHRDLNTRQEYEYRYPVGQPAVRKINVHFWRDGKAFDKWGNQIVIWPKIPRATKHVAFLEPGSNLVPASSDHQTAPLRQRRPSRPHNRQANGNNQQSWGDENNTQSWGHRNNTYSWGRGKKSQSWGSNK